MFLDSPKPIRIVPSGHIYRQMFDAQLQLNRSLTHYDPEMRIQRLKSRAQSQSLPLVRLDKEETQHGILTNRQKIWISSFPNDPYVENPVLYKQYSEFMSQKQKQMETSEYGKEVRGLPDIVVPKKQGSDIVERIANSRKQRHDSSVEDMHQDLSVISTEMEPRIEEISTKLLNNLSADYAEIETILMRIQNDEDLLNYQLEDLFFLWEDVQSHSPLRQAWIDHMDMEMKQVEEKRMAKIRDIFTNYGEKMHKISHLMAPNMQRFLDTESQMINQMMLSNRRSYADLYVRLMSADVEREKGQHTMWRCRVEDWKSLNTRLAVQSFKDFMGTQAVVNPERVENVRQTLLSDQQVLNSQRLQLINTLCEMKPPNSTKSAVYRWRKDMKKLTSQLDNITQIHMRKLHKEYEKVCQSCLEKVDEIKLSLQDSGICSEHRAGQVIDEFMLPLVGDQQRTFEHDLETMENLTENHGVEIEGEITALFKFSQGAAHIWDVHEIGLARQERALQEKLEACRQVHDHSNQEKEANLDMVMDRMRQDATEVALKDSLLKALTMLEKIRKTYEEFHVEQTTIVQTYPIMIQGELETFDQSVCAFFTVARRPVLPAELQVTEPTESEGGEKSKQLDFRPPEDSGSYIEGLVRTDKGTEFDLVTKPDDADAETVDGGTDRAKDADADSQEERDDKCLAFFTEVEGQQEGGVSTKQDMPDFIKSVHIPASIIEDVRKVIRLNFLNHLDEWGDQALERADSVVVAKCEELNSELDLRLHLHQPRPRRAELDVHNVRAAELVMHSERVTRHSNGMDQSLIDLGHRFKVMTHDHNKLAKKFQHDIEALEVIFLNATKSARLVKLQNQVAVELDKFMSVIRTTLRQFRQHLDQNLQMLRESNARFIKSFKLFSDGGNFCPEEVEEFRKKLEKMSSTIDNSEGSIMSDLEGMESKRLDTATKISVEFEDRFKGHMNDLVFMERVARWLTNTQVKIKAEVANSNTQAQGLSTMLDDLERRIDACDKPNFDKERITVQQLNETLSAIFKVFVTRSEYLNCVKVVPPGMRGSGAGPTVSAKVAIFPESMSKGGKPEAEDPSVSAIKGILNGPPSASQEKTQRSKLRFGTDAEVDGDTGLDAIGAVSDSASGKTKGSEPSKSAKKGIPNTVDTAPKKSQSGHRRISKPTKFDKKFLLFGDKSEDGDGVVAEQTHFLAVVTRTLRDALGGLLNAADVFYRQKGMRPVTRPQALQETFEQCADVISQKMHSYFQQADQYHNQCLQELRVQLTRLEQLCALVPGLVIGHLLMAEVVISKQSQTLLTEKFQVTLDQLAERQDMNHNDLRPTLGHPHRRAVLETLCRMEEGRREDYSEAVNVQTQSRQECTLEESKAFLERLVQTSELQLMQYDQLLVMDDVEKGRVEPTRYPTSELIRRKNAGDPLEDEEIKDALPRGKANWIGVPSNQFVLDGPPGKLQVTPTVHTAKTTLAHSATVKARDKAFEDYTKQFVRTLVEIESDKEKQLLSGTRWDQAWEKSVEKIKTLYQKEG